MVVRSGPSAPLTLSFSDVITHSLKRSLIAMSTWQIPATRPGRSPFIVTSLPADASAGLPMPRARQATPPVRSRAQHDFYANTGLLHFEGRSFPGWQHHVTLVSVARGWSHLCDAPREAELAFN